MWPSFLSSHSFSLSLAASSFHWNWHLKSQLPSLSEACLFTVGLLIWKNPEMSGCINTQGKIHFIKVPTLKNYMLLLKCFATLKSLIIPFFLMTDVAYVYTCFSWLMTVHRSILCIWLQQLKDNGTNIWTYLLILPKYFWTQSTP